MKQRPSPTARLAAANQQRRAELERREQGKQERRAKKLSRAAEQQRKAGAKNRIWIPPTKKRLADYQPGPVFMVESVHDAEEVLSMLRERNGSRPAPESDEFLRSYEWRRVRMMVLKRDGAKCACCGATPATGAVVNVDHVKPRKLYPQLALDPNNCQVLCGDCNHGKGNWDMTDWRKREPTKTRTPSVAEEGETGSADPKRE